MGESETNEQVQQAGNQMVADAQIQALVSELTNWPGLVISSHTSAGQPSRWLKLPTGRIFQRLEKG